MSTETVLDVRNIKVGFRRKRREPIFWALDGVSLSIRPGRTAGLVGESGSGKSTLARAVMGLQAVDGGTIEVAGVSITASRHLSHKRLARDLQAVFQDPTGSLNPSYTIGRSLGEPLVAQGVARRQIRARVEEALVRVGMDPSAADRLPRHFSGGQRQRICIARALMTQAQVVVCDEAVSALDLSVQAQVLNLLMDLQDESGLAYLFISHDMNVVRHLCHDVTVLYRGQVMESGPTSQVVADPSHPYTRALLDAAPVADPERQAARRAAQVRTGTATATGATEEGCPFASRCAFVQDRCRTTRPPLVQASNGVSVACHRFPEWKSEAPPTSPAETAPQGSSVA
ncbi:peptide/nickel transport system ATP-binding protein [Nocardioides alpinus]|uniref:ABC transporter ATP-binding protein n=2 Tax=Nocardioides TaxID=1839 RepID=A0A4Q2SMW0_9ACTN|nr:MULTISPECIES: oligopeptide/dipeptide ABC transporter ATP-binding protein [Nocardioides]PKH38472.1 ABC transporter ATP-binding protein [Nocardioides alpinus]RYC05388.1 ABC transporter ATP-binding protein [Nocardioides zhouii]SFB47979.1 peptide/nickel transport system ATP-binding protein [Nocardioides alpinus]